MRFSLRTFVLAPAILAAAALASTSAMAEATLKVPFNFTVSGKQCAAGLYSVKPNLTHGIVTLQSKDGARTFNWLLTPGDPAPSSTRVTLRFNELGNAYTLRTVEYGSLTTTRLDKKSPSNEHVHTRVIQGQ